MYDSAKSKQVVSIYMGTVVNLAEWWDPYKASKAALNNTLHGNNIKLNAVKHASRLQVIFVNLLWNKNTK